MSLERERELSIYRTERQHKILHIRALIKERNLTDIPMKQAELDEKILETKWKIDTLTEEIYG